MEQSILEFLRHVLFHIGQAIFPALTAVEIEIAKAKDPKFGDYQCNSAMKIAKKFGKNPQEWAKTFLPLLEKATEDGVALFKKVDVQGPGFLNLTLSNAWLLKRLSQKLSHTLLSQVPASERQRIVIDFSSPNIAKEMHVGHLRSTIIGDCLARIFEAKGHDVLRLNHVGDWGTAFGMLIEHIRSMKKAEEGALISLSLQELMQLYKESKVRFDNDPEFRAKAQKAVVELQAGHSDVLNLWKILCDTSRKSFQEIYNILDVRLMERGESFYNDMLPNIVDEYKKKGLVQESDMAQCIFLEGFLNREGEPLPLMIQKSDGGYNYDTTDLAALSHRIIEEKADRIIIVTDSGQATHFQMIFAAAKKAGILDTSKVRVDHVPFGLVLGPDGKKFKTRSGETEKLIDLLKNAIVAAKKILDERNPSWSEKDKVQQAKILGIGAIKYADLSSHRLSDYVFNYEKMLRFEGNTAAFIMYSYVRTRGIVRNSSFDGQGVHTRIASEDLHPSEIALIKALLQFDEVIEDVEESLLPNRLTDYLYSLSEQFNIFFRDCRVCGDAKERERLVLVHTTSTVLKQGLALLGIEVPEKM